MSFTQYVAGGLFCRVVYNFKTARQYNNKKRGDIVGLLKKISGACNDRWLKKLKLFSKVFDFA
jgi:hypothetical protein